VSIEDGVLDVELRDHGAGGALVVAAIPLLSGPSIR
jgi:hypothetical protein